MQGAKMIGWIKRRIEAVRSWKKFSVIFHELQKRVSAFIWSFDNWHHVAVIRYKEGGDALYLDGSLTKEHDKGNEFLSDGETHRLLPKSGWTIEFFIKKKSFDPRMWGDAQQVCFANHFRRM